MNRRFTFAFFKRCGKKTTIARFVHLCLYHDGKAPLERLAVVKKYLSYYQHLICKNQTGILEPYNQLWFLLARKNFYKVLPFFSISDEAIIFWGRFKISE